MMSIDVITAEAFQEGSRFFIGYLTAAALPASRPRRE